MIHNIPLGVKLDFFGVDNEYFRLGDKVYHAIEDPNDGYRSCCDVIACLDPTPTQLLHYKHKIVEVRARERQRGPFVDALELLDDTGHVWLEVGTDHTDAYYPSFVFRYLPKKG